MLVVIAVIVAFSKESSANYIKVFFQDVSISDANGYRTPLFILQKNQ